MRPQEPDSPQRMRRLPEGPGASNAAQAQEPTAPPSRFSIIIPALNEESALPETLSHLNVFREVADVIVVDGGSRDETVRLAREAGARVLEATRGRGPQMNTGARVATTDNLLFLHADCRLPLNAFVAAQEVFDRGNTAGLFAIDFGSAHVLLRGMSRLSRWPSRWTQFGEGALFMKRSTFEAVGGFPDWPLMEDVEMLRRLRRRAQLGSAQGTVRASPRRFLENGIWRQTMRNVFCYTMFHWGVQPQHLVRWYTGAPAQGVTEQP